MSIIGDQITNIIIEKIKRSQNKLISIVGDQITNIIIEKIKRSQNKLMSIVGDQITNIIIEKIKDCNAWSLVVDSTPDVTHTEQLSMCVRIVGKDGLVTEHILACKEASGTTASGFFSVIVKTLESKNVSFEKLVAQTYDGASNMSGFYNGLQAIIKERVGKFILYVH